MKLNAEGTFGKKSTMGTRKYFEMAGNENSACHN